MNTPIVGGTQAQLLNRKQGRLIAVYGMESFRAGEADEPPVTARWTPFMEVADGAHELVIKGELPEMKKVDVKISVRDGVLLLSGERRLQFDEESHEVSRAEREFATFLLSFTLPAGTVSDKVTANFNDGVLRVRLPKDLKAVPGAGAGESA